MIVPRDVLEVARELSQGETEAQWRSAVSRAYYAAFLLAQQWHNALPAHGDDQGVLTTHDKVIRQLLNPNSACPAPQQKLGKEVAAILQTLKAMRVVADYKLDRRMTRDQATMACTQAGLVFYKLG